MAKGNLEKKRLTSRKQKPGEISNFQKRWKNEEVSVCTFDFFLGLLYQTIKCALSIVINALVMWQTKHA
jgi:hypothetical protein